jgi:TIR domain
MASLSPEQLHNRLKFDYRIAMYMRSPLMSVEAFSNVDDLVNRRSQIASEEASHLGTYYRLDYRVRTLIGPGQYSDKTTVKIDLLANNNYPYSPPLCWVISGQTPWSPHFREGFPICISEDLWSSSGTTSLGGLLVHIAKLLNLDETPRSEFYGGYNPQAAEYWRTTLNSQPINPQLMYPSLPPEVETLSLGAIANRILGVHKRNESKRPLRVFLCHSSSDKEIVRRLYTRLCGNGIDAWLDEEKLLPGQKWEVEIPKAVKNSDVVIVCLSTNAIDKSGYIQKEILIALDVADEKPEDTIFLIPFRLEPCDIPHRLRRFHCAPFHQEEGYQRLMLSLNTCANKLTDL